MYVPNVNIAEWSKIKIKDASVPLRTSRCPYIQIVRPEMMKFKIFKEKIFILWELHSKILVVTELSSLSRKAKSLFYRKKAGAYFLL
jgi:hypothetical protein